MTATGAGQRWTAAGQNFQCCLILQLDGVYLRNNLPKIKDGAYLTKLDKNKSMGTHWIAWYVHADNITYYDSFGVEYVPEEIKKFIDNRNIIGNICRIQAYISIRRGYFCVWFIDFMSNKKSIRFYQFIFSKHFFTWKNNT